MTHGRSTGMGRLAQAAGDLCLLSIPSSCIVTANAHAPLSGGWRISIERSETRLGSPEPKFRPPHSNRPARSPESGHPNVAPSPACAPRSIRAPPRQQLQPRSVRRPPPPGAAPLHPARAPLSPKHTGENNGTCPFAVRWVAGLMRQGEEGGADRGGKDDLGSSGAVVRAWEEERVREGSGRGGRQGAKE